MKTTYSWKLTTLPPPNKKLIKKMLKRMAELCGLDAAADWTANVMFVSDKTMSSLNCRFLRHQGTTDVITFSYFDDGKVAPGDDGVDLAVCADVAVREGAARQNSSYAQELTLYLVHGFLHAAGEDDLTPAATKKMRRREREVMTELRREFALDAIFPVNRPMPGAH